MKCSIFVAGFQIPFVVVYQPGFPIVVGDLSISRAICGLPICRRIGDAQPLESLRQDLGINQCSQNREPGNGTSVLDLFRRAFDFCSSRSKVSVAGPQDSLDRGMESHHLRNGPGVTQQVTSEG